MIIMHRCTTCQRTELDHRPRVNIDSPGHQRGAPEIFPSVREGKINPYIYPPGTNIRGVMKTCGCQDCRALFSQAADPGLEFIPVWYDRPELGRPEVTG